MRNIQRKSLSPNATKILDAALERLAQEGFALELSNIKMEDAIAASGVSRATAYRHWRTRQDFLTDVLVEAIKRTNLMPDDNHELNEILELITANEAHLENATVRRNLVVEGLRISIRGDIAKIAASDQWKTMLSLSALHPFLSEPKVRNEIGRALRETEASFDAHRAGVYRSLATLLGYRFITTEITEEDGFAELATAAGTMMRGIVLRGLPDPEWLTQRHTACLFGSTTPAPWSVPERLLTQTLLSRLEPDPTLSWDETRIRSHLQMAKTTIRELYEAN